MIDISKEVKYLVDNWDKIPERFKKSIMSNGYYRQADTLIPGVPSDEHVVILLLDRQKPSVEQSWDFDEERISITKTGKVIWGFDSGCSCPSPWHDSYPDCYSCSNSWTEFEMNIEKFDHGAVDECMRKIEEIKQSLNE